MLADRGHLQHSGDSRNHLDLWFSHTKDEFTEPLSHECEQVLTDAELDRSKAFRFQRDRRTYLAARMLIRNALSNYLPIAPNAWQFHVNKYGKPAIHPDCGLQFNISHSTEMVFCLIGMESKVGIDAEPLIRASEIADLYKNILSPRELAQFEILRDTERSNRAISLWTLKEAYVKARGFGLSLPLEKVSFLFDERHQIHLDLDTSLNDHAANWRFCLLDLQGHRVALAVDTKNHAALRIWEAPSSSTPKTRRHPEAEIWFPT
jgi:4'-phosphopantetheinyl transferase